EVKPTCADGTALTGGRVSSRQIIIKTLVYNG
ncbi:MAG: hypothetical protein ACJAVN_001200, partial [Roseivirga sp.]